MYGSFGWMDEHLFFFILFYFLPTSCNFPSVTIFSFESSTLPPLTHLWQSWLQIKHQGAVVTRTKPISTSLGRAIFREGPWHTLGQLPKSLDFIDLFLWWQHLFFFFSAGCWQNNIQSYGYTADIFSHEMSQSEIFDGRKQTNSIIAQS